MKSPQNAPQSLDLKSFGLVLAALLGLFAGTVVANVDAPVSGPGAALLVALPVALVSWIFPRVLGPVLHAWTRVGKVVGRATRYYVLALLFGVLWLVGRAGGRIQLTPAVEDQSGWIPRDSLGPAYESQSCTPLGAQVGRTWGSLLFGWSRRTGNTWLVAILPLLLLLAALNPQGKRSMGGSTYTLY